MKDLNCLYVDNLAWLLPLNFPFLLYLAAVTDTTAFCFFPF